ncbi:hypothetical protein [Hahella sp. NBU794]|uniref:hypothetical protein n=1 Tax=Hahella sp. NBU794 TaxID=3422590 RepID=UPI003D700B5D
MNEIDLEYIDRVLAGVKEHYKEWVDSYSPNPLSLCQFAYYEQCASKECCKNILESGASIALGNELVVNGICDWIIYNSELALRHKNLGILTFERIASGEWFSDVDQPEKDWPKMIKK